MTVKTSSVLEGYNKHSRVTLRVTNRERRHKLPLPRRGNQAAQRRARPNSMANETTNNVSSNCHWSEARDVSEEVIGIALRLLSGKGIVDIYLYTSKSTVSRQAKMAPTCVYRVRRLQRYVSSVHTRLVRII